MQLSELQLEKEYYISGVLLFLSLYMKIFLNKKVNFKS